MIYPVTCHVCGEDWNEDDDRVFFSAGMWECTDESACLDRVLAGLEASNRGEAG